MPVYPGGVDQRNVFFYILCFIITVISHIFLKWLYSTQFILAINAIRDDEDLAGATAEKYRYIRDQQMESRERGLMFLDDGNLPVLPTWEEQIQQLPEVPADDAGQE